MRHPPLLRRQEPSCARRRQVEVEVEAEVLAPVVLLGVLIRHEGATGLGGDLGKQHQELFDVGLVGERDLADADQIGQHDRQGGLQPLDQLPGLPERWAAVVQERRLRPWSWVFNSSGHGCQVRRPRLNRI